jgi:hypothetical protein
MMLRNPNARSKEVRSAQRRVKKEQKLLARQAARQARKEATTRQGTRGA